MKNKIYGNWEVGNMKMFVLAVINSINYYIMILLVTNYSILEIELFDCM
jgi:hypothetical protein